MSKLVFSKQSQKSFSCHLVEAVRAKASGGKEESKSCRCALPFLWAISPSEGHGTLWQLRGGDAGVPVSATSASRAPRAAGRARGGAAGTPGSWFLAFSSAHPLTGCFPEPALASGSKRSRSPRCCAWR